MLVINGTGPDAGTGEACWDLSLLALDAVTDSTLQEIDSAAD